MGNRTLEHMSALEQDLELELEDGPDSETDDDEREAEDREMEHDSELEAEEEEESAPFDSFLEGDRDRSYGDRLADLASREYEDEAQLEVAVREVLDDMEREYFFGRFGKFVKKAGRSLVKRGMRLAKNMPIAKVVSGVTSLARGNLKGMLGSLLKAGLASAIPGGALMGPLLSSLSGPLSSSLTGGAKRALAGAGLDLSSLGGSGAEAEAEAEFENDSERFERLAEVAQTAFEELAGRLTEQAAQPIEASRIAQSAIEAAMRKHTRTAGARAGGRRRHITLRRGETLVITRE